MLERLSIRNVGGVGRCELSFGEGLTVVTGESGAGKSSIVRSMELAAGKRGQSSLIRAGEEEASVDAVFHTDVRFPELEDDQQPTEGTFLVKRVLSRVRGRAVLQGAQVPVTLYSSSVGRMVHIQSQFAQLELLDAGRQLAMVDSCGGDALRASLRELREVFEQARLKEREIKDMTDRRAEIERRYANASEVVPLVKKVNPAEGLEASLESEIAELTRRAAGGTKIAQGLDRLTGGMSERGLLDELENVCGTLCGCLPDEESAENGRLLRGGLRNLKDFADAVRKHAGDSPEALSLESENLEQRLGSLRKLRRLSGAKNEEELLTYCRDAEREMAWLEESHGLLEKATLEARELRRQASRLAMSVREARKSAAGALESRVNVLLRDLAMDGTDFSISFTELPKLRRYGADGTEFTLSANKGSAAERSGRVEKIASGGELSRLLLALQLSLPDEWLPPTLVFDEVEAGLGGKAAVLSGLKLKELSRRGCQVILVTHEASIAALGDRHYVVRKESGESRAVGVDGEERVREIARMLSGDPDLPEAQEHARRLLQSDTERSKGGLTTES
ncbi:MAG: AAA family ATPase [Synergistaceae bacterium]|nr:AAA family ATPase [Synergistaceae bacterium]